MNCRVRAFGDQLEIGLCRRYAEIIVVQTNVEHMCNPVITQIAKDLLSVSAFRNRYFAEAPDRFKYSFCR